MKTAYILICVALVGALVVVLLRHTVSDATDRRNSNERVAKAIVDRVLWGAIERWKSEGAAAAFSKLDYPPYLISKNVVVYLDMFEFRLSKGGNAVVIHDLKHDSTFEYVGKMPTVDP